jgi:hypothetical protein
MRLYIPHSLPGGKSNSAKRFNRACSSAVKAKLNAFNTWRSNPPVANHQAFIQARNFCKEVVRTAKAAFLKKVANKLAECPNGSKAFWSLATRVTRNF